MKVLVGSNPTASASLGTVAKENWGLQSVMNGKRRGATMGSEWFPRLTICNAARAVRGRFAKPKPDESPKRFDSFALRQPRNVTRGL